MKLKVSQSLIDLKPSSLVSLFVIDFTVLEDSELPVGLEKMYLHNHIEGGNANSVWFGGKEYLPVPVEWAGSQVRGDGKQLPRPRIKIANVNGIISSYIKMTHGLKKTKVSRFRVFAKNLDAKTWEGTDPPFDPDPDLEARTPSETFYINKVLLETPAYVEVELSSALDLFGINIPRRRMYATNCSFEYRNGSGCNYGLAPPKATSDDREFESPEVEGGHGVVLSDKGFWNKDAVYNKGDYVFILSSKESEHIPNERKKFAFVAMEDGLHNRHPTRDKRWKMDACSLSQYGCSLRFDSELGLPFGGFAALQRVEMG